MSDVSLFLVKSHLRKWRGVYSNEELHRERLYALFYLFGEKRPVFQCLVDTGAILTVLPQEVWEGYAEKIEWLETVDKPVEGFWTGVSGLTGGTVPCRIGMVNMTIIDTKKRVLNRRIAAKCAVDNGTIPQTLLGLGGYMYDGGKLELMYDEQAAWIRSRPET